jgi:hypothetical protein
MTRPSLSDRIWALLVVVPTALMSATGFGLEQNQAVSPAFKPMVAFVPFEAWAVGWLIVAAFAALTIIGKSLTCFRLSLIAGWALSTGLWISVLWAKYVDNAQITFVGVSWVYFLWATFGYATFRSQVHNTTYTERS